MNNETMGPRESHEATIFNLQQADNKFMEALQSATSEDQLRDAIETLHAVYSDAVVDSAEDNITEYLKMFVSSLQSLKNISTELKTTIDSMDYDQICTILEGLSDDYISKQEKEAEELGKSSLDQIGTAIDNLFVELGAIKE